MTENILSINEIMHKLNTSEFILKGFSDDISLSLPTICHYDNEIAYKLFIYRVSFNLNTNRISIAGVLYINSKTGDILKFDEGLPKKVDDIPELMWKKSVSDNITMKEIKEFRKKYFELFDKMHLYVFTDTRNLDDNVIAFITEYFSIMKKLSSKEMLHYYYYVNKEFFDWMLEIIK